MKISSYTNYQKLQGVEVHTRGDKTLKMSSATTLNISDIPVSSRINAIITVNNSGVLTYAGASSILSNSVEFVHSGGKIERDVVANHTVQNVLYGGSAVSCTYGTGTPVNSTVVGAAASSIVVTSTKVGSGSDKRVNYISTITEHRDSTTFTVGVASANYQGSAVVTNNGVISSGTLNAGGHLFIRDGGSATSMNFAGAGIIDVMHGGTLSATSDTAAYASTASAQANIIRNIRVYSSAVYDIPVSGYNTNGSCVWYKADGTAVVTTLVVNGASDIFHCYCVLSNFDATVNGSYSLMVSAMSNVESKFEVARSGIWKNMTTLSSLTDYYGMKRVENDGYPSWCIYHFSSDNTSTLVGYAPAYVDTTSSMANVGICDGARVNAYDSGLIQHTTIPTHGTLNVMPGAVVIRGYVSAGGMLNINGKSIVGINGESSPISALGDAKINLIVDNFSSNVYGLYSSALESAVVAPTVNIQRYTSSGQATSDQIGNLHVGHEGNVTVLNKCKITSGDTVYANSGVSAKLVSVYEGGNLLLNSGAEGNVTVYSGGVLEVMNAASAIVTVNAGGKVVVNPLAKGTTIVNNSGAVEYTLSRYVAINAVGSNTTNVSAGYLPADMNLPKASWYISNVEDATVATEITNIVITSATSDTIGYSITSGGTTLTGTMSKIAASNYVSTVYADTNTTSGVNKFNIEDGSDTLELIETKANGDTRTIASCYKVINGLICNAYALPSGVKSLVNITDRVAFNSSGTFGSANYSAGFTINSPISCNMVVSGKVTINGLDIVGTTDVTTMTLAGYKSTIGASTCSHNVTLTGVNAPKGFDLNVNQNVTVSTILPKYQSTDYDIIRLHGSIAKDDGVILYLAQGNNYQYVDANGNAVGLDVGTNETFDIGGSIKAYATYIEPSGTLDVTSSGYCSGINAESNGKVIVTTMGSACDVYALGDGVEVTIQDSACCDIAGTDSLDLMQQIKIGTYADEVFTTLKTDSGILYTLSKGMTNSQAVVGKIYDTVIPPLGIANYEGAVTSTNIPFWYTNDGDKMGTASGVLGVAASYQSDFAVNLLSGTAWKETIFTSNVGLNTWSEVNGTRTMSSGANGWAITDYTVSSAAELYRNGGEKAYKAVMCDPLSTARTTSTFGYVTMTAGTDITYTSAAFTADRDPSPIGGFRTVANQANHSQAIPVYVNGFQVVPHVEHRVKYHVYSKSLISANLTAGNNNLLIDTYRTGSDAEGNIEDIAYNHTDSWVNSNITYYDSGVTVPTGAFVAVASKTLVGATVMSSGTFYIHSSALVYNLTKENGCVVLGDSFTGKYFAIQGDAVVLTKKRTGKLDDYVNVTGNGILGGDTSTYMLTMVDTLTAGDDRVWEGLYTNTSDVFVVSKNYRLLTSTPLGATQPYWFMNCTSTAKYIDTLSTIKDVISAGSTVKGETEPAALAMTKWNSGLVTIASSGTSSVLKINNTSVGVLSHVTYNESGIPTPSDAYFPVSTLFYTTDANRTYILATSENDVILMSRTASSSYKQLDTMDGIVTNLTTVNTCLENANAGLHTRDPWWISSVDNRFTTMHPENFIGATIRRVDTNNFEIYDKTNYTYFRVRIGDTLTVSADYNNNITLSNCYFNGNGITFWLGRNNGFGNLITCSGAAGYISACNNTVISNCTFGGANIQLQLYASSGRAYMDKVELTDNSIASANYQRDVAKMNGIYPSISSIKLQNGNNSYYSTPAYHQAMVMSGSYAAPTHYYMHSRGNFSGCAPIFEDYVRVTASGYWNSPYYMCSAITSTGAGLEFFYELYHQVDNYNFNVETIGRAYNNNNNNNNDAYTAGNTMGGWAGYLVQPIAKAYVAKKATLSAISLSSGSYADPYFASQMFVSENGSYRLITSRFYSSTYASYYLHKNYTRTGRFHCMLDVYSSAGAIIRYEDEPYQTPITWATPDMGVVRVPNTDYKNTNAVFDPTAWKNCSDHWTSTWDKVYSCIINSAWNTPIVSTLDSAEVITPGTPNYYMFNNVSSANITSTIVHMKPGTVLSSAKLGDLGGLFVDNHALAFNVDGTEEARSTYQSTIKYASNWVVFTSVVDINGTHRMTTHAMNDGVVMLKANGHTSTANGYEVDYYNNNNNNNNNAYFVGHATGTVVFGTTEPYTYAYTATTDTTSSASKKYYSRVLLFTSYISAGASSIVYNYIEPYHSTASFNPAGEGLYEITSTVDTNAVMALDIWRHWCISGTSTYTTDGYRNTSNFYSKYVSNIINGTYRVGVFVYKDVVAATSNTNGTINSWRDVSIGDSAIMYVGSSATISCNQLYVYNGGTLIIAPRVDATSKFIDAYNCRCYGIANIYVMNGADINFNDIVSSCTVNTNYDKRYMFSNEGRMNINIMSNFVLSNIRQDNDATMLAVASDYKNMTVIGAYDLPMSAVNGNVPTSCVFTSTGTDANGRTIYTNSSSGLMEAVRTMSWATGITDPVTGSSFDGWVIKGTYEPTPGNIVANATLYACSHVNPAGNDWMLIDARYNKPIVYAGNQNGTIPLLSHIDENLIVYDCSHNNVTNLDYVRSNYPTIIHVNGYVSGTVAGEVNLGECGIIATGTVLAANKTIHIYDQVIRDNRIPNGLEGLIKFHGTTILDYHPFDSAADSSYELTSDTTMHLNTTYYKKNGTAYEVVLGTPGDAIPANTYYEVKPTTKVHILDSKFVMSNAYDNVSYNFEAGSVIEPVQLLDYVFVNSASQYNERVFPFTVSNGTFTAATTSNGMIVCMQPMSNVVFTDNVKARTLHTVYSATVASGANVRVDSKFYKAHVLNGGVLQINNYARNVVVESGGVVQLTPHCDIRIKRITDNSAASSAIFSSGLPTRNKYYTFRYTSDVDNKYGPSYRVWSCIDSDAGISGCVIKANNPDSATIVWGIYSGSTLKCEITSTIVKDQGPEQGYYKDHLDIDTVVSGLPTIDNLVVMSGGSAVISGFVTGFSSAVGAHINSNVDSRYIRTSASFAQDFDWTK